MLLYQNLQFYQGDITLVSNNIQEAITVSPTEIITPISYFVINSLALENVMVSQKV